MDYSDRVLDEAPARVTKFLSGLCADPTIRAKLGDAGMTTADVDEGCRLLVACLSVAMSGSSEVDTGDARAQRAAVAELDRWDEPNFARLGAALRRRHPGVADYLFHELAPASGPLAVAKVATLLARLTTLESGADPHRSAPETRRDDRKAVALLASRGLDDAERARLQQLVDTALGATSPLAPTAASARQQRRARLLQLKEWLDEWATTAHAVLDQRRELIRLGLAARKPPEKPRPRK